MLKNYRGNISISKDKVSERFIKSNFIILAVASLVLGGFFIFTAQAADEIITVYVDDNYNEESCIAASHTLNTDCFATIQAGIDAVAEGGTVNVAAGTYHERITIEKELTIQSTSGAENTIIDGSGVCNNVVNIWYKNVKFEGFTVTNPTAGACTDAGGIYVQDPSNLDATLVNNVSVLNNIVEKTKNPSEGASSYGPAGIVIGPSSDVTISGNTIGNLHNCPDLEDDHTAGINVWGNDEKSRPFNIKISNNTISDTDDYGILLEYASDVQIEKNLITGCEIGIKGVNVSGLTVNLNNLADNSIQVLDAAEALDIEQVLTNNTFDRAVVINRPSASLLYTVWSSIQDAIDAATTSDTINVAAGMYNEQVVIDKQLTLNGANADVNAVTGTRGNESIIDGGTSTAITISVNDVIVDGLTLDGGITLDNLINPISGGTISNNIITEADNPEEPTKAQNGIRVGWDNGEDVDYITIEGNIISYNLEKGVRFANPKLGGGTASYIIISGNKIENNGSAGIETYGPGHNTIINNIISGNDGNGINLKFDDGNVVTGNTITNNTGPGITLRQVTNTVVENNSVSGHTSEEVIKTCETVPGGKGSGIHIFDTSEDNTIRFNEISGNNYGIFIHSKDDLQPSGNSINFNNITGNINYGILNALVSPPIPVDATNNWWGDAIGPEQTMTNSCASGSKVSENVDYSPWLDAAYPESSERSYNVENISTSTTYNCIQDAIDAANSGDTINVAAGTYNEEIFIKDKSLTLLGAQADVPIIEGKRAGDESVIRGKGTGTRGSWCVVRIQHSDVVIDGFTIENGKRGIALQGIGEGVSDILISYNYIGNTGTGGSNSGIFRDSAVANVIITHNYIASNPNGIKTNGGGTTITDNMFYENGTGIDFQGGDPYDKYFPDYTEPIYPTTISGNSFTNDSISISLRLDKCHQSIEITGNDMTEARSVAIKTWRVYEENIANPAIHYNNIWNNESGINNQVTEVNLDASQNWWGDATGPKQTMTNSCANGDEVSENINYSPWLGAAYPERTERSYNVENINSSTTYKCIQDAIDDATTSDTINVAVGTYNESVIINENNLTILGDSDPRPAITGGLKLDTDLTDLTFKNFVISGNAVDGKNSIVRMYGAITNLTIDNCLFDGENVPSRMGFTGGQIEGDLTLTNSEFKNIAGWAVLDTRSGSGGDGSPMGIVTFAYNNVHDCNGSIVFRGLSTDWTDNVYIYKNTFENIGEAKVSDHWAAFEVNRASNVEIHDNEIRNVAECSWSEGQAMQLWKIGTVKIYGNTIENNFQGISILKWPSEETYDISGILIYQNSFLGNDQYALNVDSGLTGGPVNATNNWWGSAKPNFASMVSDNVNYSPWYANQGMTSLAGTPVDNKLTLPTEININVTTSVGEVNVKMPVGLTVTGGEGWTGEINAPEVKSNSSVEVIPEPGRTADVTAVIEIGYEDVKLIFNKAVRILITGQAGKYAGYSRGGVFTQITTNCIADDQAIVDAQLGSEGDCKIDVGSDLVIWTKHFTKFIAYTQTVFWGGGIPSDTIAPSISAISVIPGSDSATISWQTNESSLTWIVYGISTDYGEESKTTSYTTSHSVTLSELSPETTYHYQIKSKDSSGNIDSYTDKTFTTLALGEKITGDINKDNKVDISDFNLLIANWGESPSNLAADLDGNGEVDIFDFNLLMVNW